MKKPLTELSVEKDPFLQFGHWYEDHLAACDIYPTSFSLGTSSADGTVSVRTVLLKEFDSAGFVFFTNYRSKKAIHISENPKVAMLFYWPESGRQVRIEGLIEKISGKDSDKYFLSRPRESRLGAWASNQSQEIPDRKFLDERINYFTDKFRGKPVPRPAHWGGFRIMPVFFEFWQEGKFRLHDRIVYMPAKNKWKIRRLSP